MVKLSDDEKNTYREIGDRIRIARDKQGMSLKSLADLISVSEPTMSRYERGETKIDLVTLKKIAELLNVSDRWLIGWNGEDSYYLNEDTKEMAAYIAEHPEQYFLMDATRKLKPEDYKYVKDLVERLSKEDGDKDDD